MKKLLALLLSLTCLLAILAIPASAENPEDLPLGIKTAVIMRPDGSHKTLDGRDLPVLRFVFGDDVYLTGYNCKWAIALIDEEGEIEQYWNCDNDEDMLVDDEQTNTQWGLFTWGMDSKGYSVFDVWFNIPEAYCDGKNLYELAEEGRLGAFFGDYDPSQHEQNGIIDCDGGNDHLQANKVVDDLDACFAMCQTEIAYYGENGDAEDPNATEGPKDTEYVPTTSAPKQTEAPAATDAPAGTNAPSETKAAEEKKGCGSLVGFEVLALITLAAPAFLRRK